MNLYLSVWSRNKCQTRNGANQIAKKQKWVNPKSNHVYLFLLILWHYPVAVCVYMTDCQSTCLPRHSWKAVESSCPCETSNHKHWITTMHLITQHFKVKKIFFCCYSTLFFTWLEFLRLLLHPEIEKPSQRTPFWNNKKNVINQLKDICFWDPALLWIKCCV